MSDLLVSINNGERRNLESDTVNPPLAEQTKLFLKFDSVEPSKKVFYESIGVGSLLCTRPHADSNRGGDAAGVASLGEGTDQR